MAVFTNEIGERYDSNVLQGAINQLNAQAIDDLYISGQINSWSPREAAIVELMGTFGFNSYQINQILQSITVPNIPQPAWLTDSRSKEIQGLYRDLLGREADPGGLKYWYDTGADTSILSGVFKATEEYQSRQTTPPPTTTPPATTTQAPTTTPPPTTTLAPTTTPPPTTTLAPTTTPPPTTTQDPTTTPPPTATAAPTTTPPPTTTQAPTTTQPVTTAPPVTQAATQAPIFKPLGMELKEGWIYEPEFSKPFQNSETGQQLTAQEYESYVIHPNDTKWEGKWLSNDTINFLKGQINSGKSLYNLNFQTPGNSDLWHTDDIAKRLTALGITNLNQIGMDETKGIYNKQTGKALDTAMVGGKGANIIGSTGAGKGYSNYTLQFDAFGSPIIVPEWNQSNFLAKNPLLTQVLAMGASLLVPGIGQAIAPYVSSVVGAAAAPAVSNFLVRTAVNTIFNGGDLSKAFLGAATGTALNMVTDVVANELANSGIISGATAAEKLATARLFAGPMTNAIYAISQGQDPLPTLLGGAVNAAISTGINEVASAQKLDPTSKALLQIGVSQAINIARTGQFNPVSLFNQLLNLGFSQNQAGKMTGGATPDTAKSNTAIGAVAVDKNGELYTVDDDGNRLMLSGNSAGRVYTPTEWNSIQTALSAGQAQYVNGLINAMNSGSMNSEEVAEDLHLSGFNDATIAKIFDANEQYIYRSNQAQKLVTDYTAVGSDLSRESALERLRSLGFDEADANTYISNIDKQVTARNNYVNVSRDYINGSATESQLQTAMDAAGLTGDKADNTLLTLRAIREGGNLTSSELTNAAVANLNQWFNIGGGRQVVFKTNTEDGGLYVASARDASGKDITNDFYGLNPQGLKNFIEAQQVIQKTAPTIKAGEATVPQELATQGANLGLGGQTGLIKNNFATVQKSYFDNLLRAYSAMSPEDRAKIASAQAATTDMKILKDIDSQYKSIDQQRQAALNNGQKAIADFLLGADTRVENKASHYYLTKGVQPSTAMGLALEDIQAGNLYNRINLSEAKDSTFPFETQQFINQFRGSPAGDALANTLANAYAITGSAVANTLNGSLGISLHIAEALGLENFANDFQKMSVGIRQAGEDAVSIAGADTRAHKNFIGGLSNIVSAIPWLAMGPAGLPGLVASAGAITYGNEYLQGRMSGLDIPEASARAGTFSLIEMVTERLGLSELSQILKPMWRTVPTDQLAKVASESLITNIAKYGTKEQLGELTAFSLGVAADKYLDFGINKNITGLDFLGGALDTIQQTFWAAGAGAGLGVGLRGGMTPDNSGAIKVISPDGSQGLVELGNGSVIRVDLPSNLELKVGEQINVNALKNDVVYVPDNVNEKFANLQQQVNNAYQTELGRVPTLEELNFNIKRLADGTTINSILTELNNSPQGKLLDDQRAFTSQTDSQIAANAKLLLDQGKTTYADFKAFMNSMGLASDRQLNVLDTITPRAKVSGTVTSIVGDNAIVTGTNGQMYTMLRVGPSNYLMQVGDQVNLGVSTVKPDATPTVEVTTKIADVIAASVSKAEYQASVSKAAYDASVSTSVSQANYDTSVSKSARDASISQSLSQASVDSSTSTSISQAANDTSVSTSISQADYDRSIATSISRANYLEGIRVSISTAKNESSISQSVSRAAYEEKLKQANDLSISQSISREGYETSLSTSISELNQERATSTSISQANRDFELSQSVSKANYDLSVSQSISKKNSDTAISNSISRANYDTSVSQSLSVSEKAEADLSISTSISKAEYQAEIDRKVSISASTSASISKNDYDVSVSKAAIESSISSSISKNEVDLSISKALKDDLLNALSTSASISESLSISQSISTLASQSISRSASVSVSTSFATSPTISVTATPSVSVTQSVTPSGTQSVSQALSQSVTQSVTQPVTQSVSQSVTQPVTQSVTQTVSQSVSQSVTQSVSQSVSQSQSMTQSITPTVTQSITQPVTQSISQSITPSVTQSVSPSVTQSISQSLTQSVTQSVTQSLTQTQSLTTTIIITTTSLPPVTTTVTIPPVTTTLLPTTAPVTTLSATTVIPTVTPTQIQTTTSTIITTEPVTTVLPITTSAAVTTSAPVTTSKAPTTSAPPTTSAGMPFPLFGIPAAVGQKKTYVDYAQPNVPAPEFGPFDLFKAPSYLRPLQDTGNFGLAALLGAANDAKQGNGSNQSQQNAQGQGQTPSG